VLNWHDYYSNSEMLASKELQTIRKVLEREFKLSSEYVLFQNIVRHYGLSHSEKQVSLT
jgi:hypothetical protein